MLFIGRVVARPGDRRRGEGLFDFGEGQHRIAAAVHRCQAGHLLGCIHWRLVAPDVQADDLPAGFHPGHETTWSDSVRLPAIARCTAAVQSSVRYRGPAACSHTPGASADSIFIGAFDRELVCAAGVARQVRHQHRAVDRRPGRQRGQVDRDRGAGGRQRRRVRADASRCW